MNKSLILAASCLFLASAPAALASDEANCKYTGGEWMSKEAAKAKAVEMGYEVRRVKSEGGCYEIYALDKNGARLEIYMHPVTGELVKGSDKDD